MSVVIETTIGDITVDLFTEERPIACLNFLKLCRLKYYNFNLFHTIEQGFIAQTGDPTGKGDGGCSIWGLVEGQHKRFFEAENLPKIYHSSAGLLSLVSAGKNLAGSQFFFTLGENLNSLDGVHCVIGEVVEGHETLLKLNEAIVDESFRPYQDIRITHTVVLSDPFPDPRGLKMPERSPSPTAERLQNGRIAADEDIDDTDGKTMIEIQEMLAEREAKARATILEIVGDLPDADCAPPENVLFVCKLNPVTTDDDLEIIFSRFGKVKGCEVIRDRKTGDSLQYAFVEFEDQKACEAAYFKMDNVLIDDRRIHVDFSQSVAKVKWRGKGRGVEGSQGRLDFNNLREEKKHDRRQQNKEKEFKERERMTSEERRLARQKRHREQEKIRRSRSKSQLRDERTDRKYNSERNRRRSRSRERRDWRRSNSRDRRRPDARERSDYRRKHSPQAREYDSRGDYERRRERTSNFNVAQRYSRNEREDMRRDNGRHERDYERRGTNDRNDRMQTSRREPESSYNKKRGGSQERHNSKINKKSEHASSSDDSVNDSTSDTESSSSSSDADSSSSEEERKKKKKSTKSKKKKGSSKKKSKKHKK